MREILFRGKDLQEQNGWIYGYFYKSDINKRERESGKATLIFTPNCDTFIYCPEYHNSLMVKAETIGQYTGLCDKNGTKIFAEDIVKHIQKYEISGEVKSIAVIKWNEAYSCWSVEYTNGRITAFLGTEYHNLEVIGNVHDNPELLEGKA